MVSLKPITRKHTRRRPLFSKWQTVLPAFGIVAAVMGVVHVMGSVGQVSNAELGNMIAAALVGTFPGHLAGLRFCGPTGQHHQPQDFRIL